MLCVKNSLDAPFPVELSVEGTFADYITLSKDELTLAPEEMGCLKYRVHFPEEPPEYGPTLTKIWAKQVNPRGSGGLQVMSNIHHKFSVFVPYPEKYVSFGVKAANVNVNEPVYFTITASNKGALDVEKASCRLDIYGADDFSNHVKTLYTDTKPIASMETVEFYQTLETTGLKPGYYLSDVTCFYDGESSTKEHRFNIGTLYVKILNHTQSASAGTINPYTVQASSMWNNRIDEIYAEISFPGIATVRSPTSPLPAWKSITIKSYLDLKDISPGTYAGKITLFYDGSTTEKDVSLEIVPEMADEPHVEEPKKEPVPVQDEATIFTTTNILLLAILLMIVIDLLYIMMRKGEKKR